MPNKKQNLKTETRVNPTARHDARRLILQAMYQWQLAATPLQEIEETFLIRHADQPFDRAYFKQLLHDIPTHREEIDQNITPFLKRSLSDIDPIELAILRLATYELLKCPDLPFRVVINEALELTKQFGSVEGYKFVNSVVDRIA